MKNVFIIGAKGIGNYGGYETFLNKLTELHKNNKSIKYHIACKANGQGFMDETKLNDCIYISSNEFVYNNARCFKTKTLDIGKGQAILYDLKSLKESLKYIEKNNISNPIIYILSSRIGPFMRHYSHVIHKLGGRYYNNPDGRENLRKKYNMFVRKYWKFSEKLMVKYSDLVICDSVNIEKYIKEEYQKYQPKTKYIAYGADVRKSIINDNDLEYQNWLDNNRLIKDSYYLSVGRFVPENNFDTMIEQFMLSKTNKDFAIITNVNKKYLFQLENKLHFSKDKRIKFVGTVYNQELLRKIREDAYGYIHGHEVGGTNPSLLEALACTNLNLLNDVVFNKEVGKDSCLYWKKDNDDLSMLINNCEYMNSKEISTMGNKAKSIINNNYNWDFIVEQYYNVFMNCE